jgi:hypothetical protein
MLDTPFLFEETLTDGDFQKIGQLSLRWSHIEHIVGNCLKTMLRLTDEEAIIAVFPLNVDQRLTKIKQLAELSPLAVDAQAALDELMPAMKALQVVRNNVVHAVIVEDNDDGHLFHLRSKERSLTKAQVFSAEELTNYAAHAALSLRFALGLKGERGARHPLPERPEIPEFLRSHFPKLKSRIGG